MIEQERNHVPETIEELRTRLEIDALTGLYNREKFRTEAEALIQNNPQKDYVLVKWDVDGFKVVNELFGSEVGDKVLLSLTKVIKENTGAYGIACREERDHFVSCMEKDYFFMNMTEIVDFLETGITDTGVNYPVYVHIGVYEVENGNVSIDSMCNRAEMALQTVKDSYVKRYAFYDEKLRQEMMEEQELAGQLKEH